MKYSWNYSSLLKDTFKRLLFAFVEQLSHLSLNFARKVKKIRKVISCFVLFSLFIILVS